MANGQYRSQKIAKPSTIGDLVNYINKARASSTSSDGNLTQNQAHNNFNSGVDALVTMINESTNLNNLTDIALISNNMTSVLDPTNIEGAVKVNQLKQNLVNMTQEEFNYTTAINTGYDLLNNFTMPEYFETDFTQEDLIRAKSYISQDYAIDDTVNQNAYDFILNNPNFNVDTASTSNGKIVLQGTDADAQKAVYDSDLYTIENIQNAITAIETVEANLYTDPLKRDKEHQFVGHYFHDDGSGKKTQDIQIIKQLGIGKDKDATGGLKNNLLTVLASLEGDKIITNNELYFVLTGDEEGLDAARTQHIKSSENNLKSYRRSYLTIENYKKGILSYISKNNLNPDDMKIDMGFTAMFAGIKDSLLQVNDIDRVNPINNGKDDIDISADKLNMIEDWSVSDLLAYWAKEQAYYEILSERESKRYKVWASKDWELSDIDDVLIDAQMQKNLDKFK